VSWISSLPAKSAIVLAVELQEALDFELTDSNIDNLVEFREAGAADLLNPNFEDMRRWF